MEGKKQTERKNMNFASYKRNRNQRNYLPVLPGMILLCLMVWYMAVSPFKNLTDQKHTLEQKKKELSVLLEENKDYDEMEQAYQQWSGLEKESIGRNRYRAELLSLLKDEVFAYGNVEEMEVSEDQCRILLSGWTLEKTVETMGRIESSPLVDHVELTQQNEKTEMELWLAGGEDHES